MANLYGTAGDDTLVGSAGDDVIDGMGGSDVVDGGDGVDLVRFGGYRYEYSVSWDAATRSYTVVGSSGTTTVTGVEHFQFGWETFHWGNLVAGEGDGLTLQGTTGDDNLMGSAGYDQISGGDGNDFIDGMYADDVVSGGAGDDMIYTGMGNDLVDGGEGVDMVRFNGYRSEYSVSWDAATRSYTVVGSQGTTTVTGVEHFQFGWETFHWGNLVAGEGDGLTLQGTTGDDNLIGSAGYDQISGGDGNDFIDGMYADDVVSGGAGDDMIYTGMGNDLVDGGEGVDMARFNGYRSEYSVSWDAATRSYVVVGSQGTTTLTGVEHFQFGWETYHWGNLVAGEGDGLTLQGTTGNDTLIGSAGYDQIAGGDGNDFIDGMYADDVVSGGAGDDMIYTGMGNDLVDGGEGVDMVRFNGYRSEYSVSWDAATRSYTVTGAQGTTTLTGVEHFQFGWETFHWGNLVAGEGDGLTLQGTTGNDTLIGSAGYDQISGGDGNDFIDGMYADDVVSGGAGDDMIHTGMGNDLVDGGEGVDMVRFNGYRHEYSVSWDAATRSYSVVGSQGTTTVTGVEHFQFGWETYHWGNLVAGEGDGLALAGTTGNDTLIGSAGYDQIAGGDGNDFIDGMYADDVVSGGAGDDMIYTGMGNDVVDGGEGVDMARFNGYRYEYSVSWDADTRSYTVTGSQGTATVTGVEHFQFGWETYHWGNLVAGEGDGLALEGTGGNDTLMGSIGYDELIGSDGDDWLAGMDSNDTLRGGNGQDNLHGGAGADTFVFDTVADPLNADWIRDFAGWEDRIQLDDALFTALGGGNLDAAAFQSAAGNAAQDTAVRILFDTAAGGLYYDADGSGAAAAVQFATVDLMGLSGTINHNNFYVG